MRIKIKTQELLDAVSDIQLGAGRSAGVGPTLSLLEATDGYLTITATDLDLTISRHVPATVFDQGDVALPSKKLFSIIRSLPKEDVGIATLKNGHVGIASGATKATLPATPVSEFPKIPGAEGAAAFSLTGEEFARHLEKVHYAAATEGARYVYMGVHLCSVPEGVKFVATDGKRVSVSVAKTQAEGPVSCIIPAKTVDRLLKVLHREGKTDVVVSQSKIFITWKNGVLTSNLVEGLFPNYMALLDKISERSIAVAERTVFLEALRRAAGAAGGDRVVTLEIRKPSDQDKTNLGDTPGVMGISVPEGEEGTYCDAIPLQFFPEVEGRVSFCVDYLTQPLAVGEGDTAILKFGKADEVAFLEVGEGFLAILAPISVKGGG